MIAAHLLFMESTDFLVNSGGIFDTPFETISVALSYF